MPSINDLIEKGNWSMLSWRERYGSGIWVALAPSVTLLDNIEFISTGNDIQSIELSSYFQKQGLWLPVVKAATINFAISKLDLKTLTIPEDFLNKWMDAVQEAYEMVYELGRENGYILSSAIRQNDAALMVPEGLQEYMDSIKT